MNRKGQKRINGGGDRDDLSDEGFDAVGVPSGTSGRRSRPPSPGSLVPGCGFRSGERVLPVGSHPAPSPGAPGGWDQPLPRTGASAATTWGQPLAQSWSTQTCPHHSGEQVPHHPGTRVPATGGPSSARTPGNHTMAPRQPREFTRRCSQNEKHTVCCFLL